MDTLLAENGFLLFGLAHKTGALGEIAGGDFLYLRDPGTIVASTSPVEVKRQRLAKLFVLASLFRIPRLAYAVAVLGQQHGLFAPAESQQLQDLVADAAFLPAIAPELRSRHAIAGFFSVLAQFFAGRKWDGKAGPRSNALQYPRHLFIASRWLPKSLVERYRRYLVRNFRSYTDLAGVRYSAPAPTASGSVDTGSKESIQAR
jgi:hypothetical protein